MVITVFSSLNEKLALSLYVLHLTVFFRMNRVERKKRHWLFYFLLLTKVKLEKTLSHFWLTLMVDSL